MKEKTIGMHLIECGVKESAKKLIRFLKQNNAYEAYMFNFEAQKGDLSFKRYIERVTLSSFINGAFDWQYTSEGRGYWYDLHKKWHEEILYYLTS